MRVYVLSWSTPVRSRNKPYGWVPMRHREIFTIEQAAQRRKEDVMRQAKLIGYELFWEPIIEEVEVK